MAALSARVTLTLVEPFTQPAWLLLALGVAALVLVVNAWRPRRGPLWLLPSFFAAWWTTELPLHLLLLTLALDLLLILGGALDHLTGLIGQVLLIAAWVGMIQIFRVAGRGVAAIEAALAAAPPLAAAGRAYPRSHLLVPPLMFWRRDVEVRRGVVFSEAEGRPLTLDIYRPRAPGGRRPAILQIHGGAWIVGFKEYQGIPLLTHLAANGWVGFNIDYRLSPAAAFPAHLIDVKRALAWIRAHADELGVDPDFVVVSGGSAGGHLAALVALTAGDPEYQPGFEAADTAVQAAVVFYGVFDLTNRRRRKPAAYRALLERVVMKRPMDGDPDAYDRASPIQRIHADAPPLFIIHGSSDNLAPVQDARDFAEELRRRSREPVLYAELPGAAHAFDIFPSTRTVAIVEAVERFLRGLHDAHRDGRPRARRPREG